MILLNLFHIFLLLILSSPTIALREGIDSNFSSSNSEQKRLVPSVMKKLRKLPHVFNNVLELPLRSDADVAVEEKEGFFRFVAKIELEGSGDEQVSAQAVEIYPGITKIVVRKGSGDGEDENIKLLLEQMNMDTWRYRLPASTIPELATAVFVDGDLIVTVPTGGGGEFGDGSRGVWGGSGRRGFIVCNVS